VLLISPLHTPLAARLAGAMVGLGLEQAEQNVLVVEFDNQPGLQASVRDGNGVFVSGASGLRTVVYNRPAAEDTSSSARLGLDDILAKAGSFDFVLLMGPSVADGNWDPALFGEADLMLFALSPAEEVAEAAKMLRQRLDVDQIERSATLTIAAEHVDARQGRVVRSIRPAGDGEQGDRISARG